MKNKNEGKHTPGPWSVVKDRFNNSQVYAENRNILDDLPIADNIIEKANASLIAAAPELLEAIKELIHLPGYNAQAFGGAVPMAKILKAIDKAEGRE